MTLVRRKWRLWACVALISAATSTAAFAKPATQPRLREHGAVRLTAPGAGQTFDGCSLSLLFDDLNYQRSAGAAPKALVSLTQVWRLTLKRPARAADAAIQLRGLLAKTPGVTARVGMTFAGATTWTDLAATDVHSDAPRPDIPLVTLKTPSTGDWLDLTLTLEVRETAAAKPADSLVQLDSLDLTFKGCPTEARP